LIILKIMKICELYWRSYNFKRKWLWIVLKGNNIKKRSSYALYWRGNNIKKEVVMHCTEGVIILKRK
jgi:hypothetical protein